MPRAYDASRLEAGPSWVTRTVATGLATIALPAVMLAGNNTQQETPNKNSNVEISQPYIMGGNDLEDMHDAIRFAATHPAEIPTIDRAPAVSRTVGQKAVTQCMKIDPSRLHHTLPQFYPNIQLACELAKDQPWANDNFQAQMNALIYDIWDPESGMDPKADNPGSSAHGIPQALPGKKMGPGWQDNAEAQIKWGLAYIEKRYGSPLGAVHARQTKGYY